MNRDQKEAVVAEVATQIEESEAVFAVDYRGISVPQAAELRVKLNDAGARFRVVKNTLTLLAADKAGADPLKEVLDGPTAFTFVAAEGGDVALAAKALAQFRRETELLEFKGGVMNGEALSAEQIGEIARLPAKDVLYGQLVAMVASPITGLVRGLNALISGLAIQLKQIADQGLVGGEAEPAADGEPASEAESAADAPAAGDAAASDGDAGDAEPASDDHAGGEAASGNEEEPAAEAKPAPAAGSEAASDDASASDESASDGESASGSDEPAADAGSSSAETASDDDPAEAEQAAQADQAEDEAAQSAEGEETESSSEESAPAGDEAAGEETNESETPSEGDEKE
jgi:large subunit ribosomal protein L10